MVKWVILCGYLATVPAANWLIGNAGTVCLSDSGPCLIPVWPGLMAPSGVLMIGLALVLRDLVHELLGRGWALLAIGAGALLSLAVSPPFVALASTVAFLISETADYLVYARLRERGLYAAMLASNAVGLTVDSATFLLIAFGSLELIAGQIVGKAEMTLLAVACIWLVRQRRMAGAMA